jgi:glycosyltransferase involved in cell wall biosynthesis
MKAIINTSNLVVGGAKQVAQSFLHELTIRKDDIEFHVFLSKEMKKEINEESFPSNFTFYHIQNKPKPFFKGKKAKQELDALEKSIKPDVVFSVFGPVYWRPQSKHIAGFASGWAINPESIAYSVLSTKTKLKIKLTNWVKLFYVNQPEADKYIVETEVVKQLLNKHSNIQLTDIEVVSNTFGDQYNSTVIPNGKITPQYDSFFKFITISANYAHKNLEIIRKVIPLLQSKKLNVKFFVTLPDNEFKALFTGFEEHVINLGVIKAIDCPSFYKACDALFLPTLLESFTASYPEAMKMDLPILTSDLDFAHNLCGSAAVYCDTLNAQDTLVKIEELIANKELQASLVKSGKTQLNKFDTSKTRAEKYLKICGLLNPKESSLEG